MASKILSIEGSPSSLGSSYMDIVSANKVAKLLGLSLSDLASAAGVHPSGLTGNLRSLRLQAFLSDTLRVLNTAKEAFGEDELPVAWLLNEPLPAFHQKTAFELIKTGRTENVLAYLDSISAGFIG